MNYLGPNFRDTPTVSIQHYRINGDFTPRQRYCRIYSTVTY